MEEKQPFSDEEMNYNKLVHRYILTHKAVLNNLGENLTTRLNKKGESNIENVVNNVLNQVSLEIYNYIYSHNTATRHLQWLIASLPEAREIIKQAMLQQVSYILVNGDLFLYGGVDIRKGSKSDYFYDRAISPMSKNILDTTITGVEIPLTYSGRIFWFCPTYEEGDY